jgi:hypothetical protein
MPDRQPLRLPAALREYLREEAAGGMALMAAAAGLLLLVAGLVRARVWWLPVHVALGMALWRSG